MFKNIIKIFKKIVKKLKSTKGNSLAEFAVTTAMMATLATTAAPKFAGIGEAAKEKKTLANIDKILSAANNHYMETLEKEGRGRFPGQTKYSVKVGGVDLGDGQATTSALDEWTKTTLPGLLSIEDPLGTYFVYVFAGSDSDEDALAKGIINPASNVGYDDEEPFAKFWVHPEELTFPEGEFFCANVSVPFFYDGVRQVPKIKEVAQKAMSLGVQPIIALIVRDRNINELQQKRVGGEVTMDTALEYFKDLTCHFIDHEAFFLWKEKYIEYLGRILEFPVTTENIDNFITVDANHKYVFPVQEHWLDKSIREGRKPFKQRLKE